MAGPENQNPLDLFAAQETAVESQNRPADRNPLLVIHDEHVAVPVVPEGVIRPRDNISFDDLALNYLHDVLIKGTLFPAEDQDAKYLTIHFQLDAHGNFSVEKEMPPVNGIVQLDLNGKPAMIKTATGLKIETNKKEHIVSGNLILPPDSTGQIKTQKIPKIRISKLNDSEKIGPEGIPTGAVSYPVLIAVLEGLLKAKVTVEIDAKGAARMFDEEKGKIAKNLLRGIKEYLLAVKTENESEKMRIIAVLLEKSKQYGFQKELITVLAELGVTVRDGQISSAENSLKSKTRKIQE